jgi:hypothetical protein
MSTIISGTNGVTFPDSTSMQTGQQACKAWVNFDGTGTVAIRAQYNVSSITDNGTGDYTVNFTTAMVDANYSVVVSCGDGSNSFGGTRVPFATPTTSSVQIGTTSATNTLADRDFVNVAIFSN